MPDRDGRGLNFDALLQRIHPAASRVRMLAVETPSSFVAFDLLALGDRALLDSTLRERRALLETELRYGAPVFLTPSSTDRAVAESWFSTFEGAGLDGVVAKRLDDVYTPDKRTMVKVKHERTADCAVAGYRIHKDGKGVGSLLLGFNDADGRLHHVGVAAAFTVAFRAQLLDELEPLTHDALDGHPWRDWAEMEAHADGRMPGGGSRWNAGKDLSWVPIRVERVAEVTFGQLEAGRFRHGVQVPALAPGPHAGELRLRPARRRHAGALRGVAGDLTRRSMRVDQPAAVPAVVSPVVPAPTSPWRPSWSRRSGSIEHGHDRRRDRSCPLRRRRPRPRSCSSPP